MVTSISPPYFSGFESLSADQQAKLDPDGHPALYSSATPTTAIAVCLHGFTGMPYEVKPVAEACARYGLDAVTPLLPGHGYTERRDQQREFAQITRDIMLEAARQEITKARQRYNWVGVFGLSMGGAIALAMASEGLVDACAVAAPCLRLPRRAEILVPLLGWANFSVENTGSQSFYLPCYKFYHSWAVRELWKIARHARQRLAQVTCPTLAIHTHNDRTVPASATEFVAQQVTGPVKTIWFDESGHCMPLDVKGAEVSAQVAEFLACESRQ